MTKLSLHQSDMRIEVSCYIADVKGHMTSVTKPAGYRKRAREAQAQRGKPDPEDLFPKPSENNILLKSVDWDEPEDEVVMRVVGELPSLKSCLHLPETSVRKSHQRQIREAVGLQVCILEEVPFRAYADHWQINSANSELALGYVRSIPVNLMVLPHLALDIILKSFASSRLL